jgi:hypothetical protein
MKVTILSRLLRFEEKVIKNQNKKKYYFSNSKNNQS